MQAPPRPPNEPQRLKALKRLNILDTGYEERFDRITRIAQILFDAPFALISLVDANRQWFKSCLGLSASETPRAISFCGHAILKHEPLYIPDALADNRFADNPLVTSEPFIRSYLGCPLKEPSGEQVGTLCIIDTRPSDYLEKEIKTLIDLASLVETELARQHLYQSRNRMVALELELRAVRTLTGGIMFHCLPVSPFSLKSISDSIKDFTGYDKKTLLSAPDDWINKLVLAKEQVRVLKAYENTNSVTPQEVQYLITNSTGEAVQVTDRVISLVDECNNPVEIIGSRHILNTHQPIRS
jgi:hypothetical protein